jgi:phage shock protein PspC (stress-responsive transcriptional regulator)
MTAGNGARSGNFRRPVENRMLGGVAGALARFFDADVATIRIVFIVLAVVGGAGLPLYLAGWLLIPDETSDVSLAEHLAASFRRYRWSGGGAT